MKIELTFTQPKTGHVTTDLVFPADPELDLLLSFVVFNYRYLSDARRFRDELRRIIAQTQAPIEGGGDRYHIDINANEATIAKSFDEIPEGDPGVTSVTIPTSTLLDVMEQYVAYNQREYGSPHR